MGGVMLASVVLVLLVAGTLLNLVLRRLGIDVRELSSYRERRRIYLAQLADLEGRLPSLDVESPEFETASRTLHAFVEAEPRPPRWAFWLADRR
jgi:hypothetical protein